MRVDADVGRLPTGTVTFMFTDIEGSTGLLHRLGDTGFAELLERHHGLIATAVEALGGVEVATEGDSVFAVFAGPSAAVEAALRIQIDMATLSVAGWVVRVRIGLHTGNGVLGGDNYVGVDVHRASRISSSAHGGQVLVSDITARLVENHLPEGARLEPLGRYRLTGFPEPVSLHQVVGDGMQADFPPLRTQRAESQLPAALTDFVGRSQEIAAGLQILDDHRLVTLTGPGGTGKTRLALEIAQKAERRFGDGAYFVALASLTESSLIPMTILESMKLKTAGGIEPMEHLTRHLAERSVLLVLDNFEQLLDGTPIVSELLAAAPDVSVIVTSRSPLRIAGERELPVPPLAVPTIGADQEQLWNSDGVRLFVSRAEAVRPGFELSDDNVDTVSAIVRALDGLPLAIELAASRMRSLTPELVLDRLGNQLLTSRSTDLPARQQTIVNAISWSYDLLDDRLKWLFEQVSVFSGSFGLNEAETVCQAGLDALDDLTDLVEQSLLRQTAVSGEPRFRMLTVIREFAHAVLVAGGHDRELHDRHARFYRDLAERAGAEILTSRQQFWLERLSDEHDNLRAAFDHAVVNADSETALRIVGGLWRFWQMKGHLREGRDRIETAIAMPGEELDGPRARALTGLGGLLYWEGKWNEVHEPYQLALELFRSVGSDEEVAEALYNLSFPIGSAGDLETADELLRESLALSEATERPLGVGRAYWGLANMAMYAEDWEEAIAALEIALEKFSSLDAPFDLGWAWFVLAHTRQKMGQADMARRPLRNAVDIFADVDDMSALALILEMVAAMRLGDGAADEAAYFAGAANRLKTSTGVAIGDVELNRYDEMVEFLESLDEMRRAALEEGYNADVAEVIQRAYSLLT